jgi:hypothetical protein
LVERQIEARIRQLNNQVVVGLNHVFNEAESVLRLNARLFGAEIIDYRNPSQIRNALFTQIRSFSVPTSLYFGNLNGGVVVAGHEGKGQQFYDITTDKFLAGDFTKRRIAEDGTPLKELLVLPNYDARSRLWFQRAISNESIVTWGDVYVLFTGHELSIAAQRWSILSRPEAWCARASLEVWQYTAGSRGERFASRIYCRVCARRAASERPDLTVRVFSPPARFSVLRTRLSGGLKLMYGSPWTDRDAIWIWQHLH